MVRRSAIALLMVLVCGSILGGVDDPVQYRVDQLASNHGWSVLDWEARHLPAGLRLIWTQAFAPPNAEAVDARLRAHLAPQDESDENNALPLDLALAFAVDRQLAQDGVATLGPLVAPPVSLALAAPPRSLVVSPRDEIRLSQWALLDGTIDLAAAQNLEGAVESLNLSALAVPIGGIATYPTLIPPDTPPSAALQTIAHEWTHTALFFRPLGQAYGTSVEARTINETTADIVGAEVAAEIMSRLGVVEPKANATGELDIRQALRRIRTVVDGLLSQGDVEAAEAYMESERQALVAQGYRIRRLNQAYFAFAGNYAEGPVRSTEIPDRLRELRARSASLGEFLNRAGQVTNLAELRAATRDAETG